MTNAALARLRELRADGGPFVIAEAGVNHNGSLDEALRLVDTAADAGADAVKFQMFSAAALTTARAPAAAYQQAAGVASQRELLAGLELRGGDFECVRARCAERGLAFLATPFGLDDLQALRALQPPAIKIASPDLGHVPLVRAAAGTGLPLLLSTGASERAEIKAAAQRLVEWAALERAIFLHCISAYPTPTERLNLHALDALRELTRTPVGFSDHSRSLAAGGWAVCRGAVVLEKHFTHDRNAPGPDHALSLEPDELKQYISTAREAAAALGDGALGVDPLELDVRAHARRSIVAATALPAGTQLRPEHLAVKRPADGIDAASWDGIVGRTLGRAVAEDEPLQWDDLA